MTMSRGGRSDGAVGFNYVGLTDEDIERFLESDDSWAIEVSHRSMGGGACMISLALPALALPAVGPALAVMLECPEPRRVLGSARSRTWLEGAC